MLYVTSSPVYTWSARAIWILGSTQSRQSGGLYHATCAWRSKDKWQDGVISYREVVGSLMYLATSTRSDISVAVGLLSRFVSQTSNNHVGELKLVLRYPASTSNYGLNYQRQYRITSQIVMDGFSDSDWGGDPLAGCRHTVSSSPKRFHSAIVAVTA